jgi:4-hydroxyphenylpyruvate 3-dimethylallyltransferase
MNDQPFSFDPLVFFQDAKAVATAIGSPYSSEVTKAVIETYAPSFRNGAVMWRATSRQSDALNYRCYERRSTDTIGKAVNAELLQATNNMIPLISSWSSLYADSTELCDFDSAYGLSKTWVQFGAKRPLSDILGAPEVPSHFKRHGAQFQEVGLTLVRHVAVDYLHKTANIYFAAPGPLNEEQCNNFISLAHGQPVTQPVYADIARFTAPKDYPLSVTMRLDGGEITRVAIYALMVPPDDRPAIGERLATFFDTAPSRDDEELNVVAWSFGPAGEDYLKAECSYTGRLAEYAKTHVPE